MNRPRFMFPASAGMNRHLEFYAVVDMFPASAGMNRQAESHSPVSGYVPRERGDEPVIQICITRRRNRSCSPRARG